MGKRVIADEVPRASPALQELQAALTLHVPPAYEQRNLQIAIGQGAQKGIHRLVRRQPRNIAPGEIVKTERDPRGRLRLSCRAYKAEKCSPVHPINSMTDCSVLFRYSEL